jgi:hypothetical protein
VGRNKTYLKAFFGLYVVGTGLTALLTTPDGAWTAGLWLAVVGTLALGAYLGGRDWLRSRATDTS